MYAEISSFCNQVWVQRPIKKLILRPLPDVILSMDIGRLTDTCYSTDLQNRLCNTMYNWSMTWRIWLIGRAHSKLSDDTWFVKEFLCQHGVLYVLCSMCYMYLLCYKQFRVAIDSSGNTYKLCDWYCMNLMIDYMLRNCLTHCAVKYEIVDILIIIVMPILKRYYAA